MKKTVRTIVLLIVAILSLSATYEAAYGRVRRSTKKLMRQRYGLELDTIGSSNHPEDASKVECLVFGFNAQGKLTIDQAREYAVASTEDILELVNAADSLLPHLSDNPFRPDNMLISINFYGPDGYLSTSPFVSWVCVRNGCVFYRTREEGQKHGYSSEYVETYEDALAIFQGHKPDKS